MKAFAKVVVATDFRIGAQTLFQSFGIGPVHANTILVNGPEQLMEAKDPQGEAAIRPISQRGLSSWPLTW